MTVKQISVFLENRPGALAEFTKILEMSSIDLRALSLAESEDFGIVRVIVDDPYKTIRILKEEGYICSVTKVIAVEIADKPGSLVKMLNVLGARHRMVFIHLIGKPQAALRRMGEKRAHPPLPSGRLPA